MADNKDEQQFAFDYDALYFYSDEEEYILWMMKAFLSENKDVRGVTLLDFYEELEEKTGLKVEELFDQRELAKLITPTPIWYVLHT